MKRLFVYLFGAMFCMACRADIYKVNVSSELKVRTEATTEGYIMGKLQNGDLVDATLLDNGWAEVKMDNGDIGYVKSSYLEATQSLQSSDYSSDLEERKAKNAFGRMIPLKWCFIIICILTILNWAIALTDGEKDSERVPMTDFIFYTLMNGMLIVTYFSHDINLLVNHEWTGGWLNGYLLVFINSLLMAAVMVVEYNAFINMCRTLALSVMDKERYRKFSPVLLFFMLPICVAVGFSVVLIPFVGIGLAIIAIVYLVKQVLLFKPQYYKGLVVVFYAVLSCLACAILIKTFIVSLILGFLAIGFLRAAPGATASAVSQSMSSSSQNREEDEAQSYNEEPEYDTVIKEGGSWGNDLKAKDVGWGMLRDEDGIRWKKNVDGTVEKYD